MPSANARFVSTPPSDPGAIVYGTFRVMLCWSSFAESPSVPFCSPTGTAQINLPVVAFIS